MELLIWEAQESDYLSIYELNRSGLGYEFDVSATHERIKAILKKDSNKFFVAELDAEIVGYIHGADYDCTYSESLKNILALVVAGDKRGMGIGRKLIEAIEDWARQEGSIGVRLVSGLDREKAHAFYQACGYSTRKIQKNFIKLFE